MDWRCKVCSTVTSKRTALLKHYRLKHGHSKVLPCLYLTCPCSFKTWSALKSHLSRHHAVDNSASAGEILSFSCEICSACSFSCEKSYFQHLGVHLKKHERVVCVYENCNFSTNVYGTFAAHRTRKHASCSHFKPAVIRKFVGQIAVEADTLQEEYTDVENEAEPLGELILQKLGHLLLKLESIYNVPSKCITEVVEELHFISSSASGPVIADIVTSCLKKHKCVLHDDAIKDFVKEISESNPISSSLNADGPLSTHYKRQEYFKRNFNIVQPVEYILDEKEGRTFQYVPILPTLQHILSRKEIQEKTLMSSHCAYQYVSFYDGSYYKANQCLSVNKNSLSLILYTDEFEVCNPLGTSRTKHKIHAVYWVLGNIPPQFRSTLSSIYLAILCKAVDVKKYGYSAVLEPLLKDLAQLEDEGLFIPSLGKSLRGTVFCVAADNLGAHSIGGFVESFSASHICRFCLIQHTEIQLKEVRSEQILPRTKEVHSLHIQQALESPSHSHCFGVKRLCAITEKLKYFHVLSGYPPDLLHDLFEGIVPLELALCLNVFIQKGYLTLAEVNKIIRTFPFKWSDKTDSPQPVPVNFATRKSVGGNAHENWCLLRMLPFLFGTKIPPNEPTWQVLMDLKDLVELVVSPCHTEEMICYLDSKISEHRHRFLQAFPQERLIPKHHFVEHYPQLIRAFGPLVALWTMRFEAKHRFFKRVVRCTNSFRNILRTLAVKHQLMLAYHLNSTDMVKPALSVTKLSAVPLEVLKCDVQEAVNQKYPAETCVHVTNTVTCYGTIYAAGMILPYGSTGGLPDFVEIRLMIIIQGRPAFVVRCLNAWYDEHFRSFELVPSGKTLVLEQHELADPYPLAAYTIGSRQMVTLKHYILCHN